ncbi:MAG: DUF4194 domain-containing protein [Gammaproteobacteria bacterium]|nr:DUF4194 domain-containing protein [Gammaproteobacteria bacterium]NVK87960.1 DUF4194 domain-containing protein [Gammaproteobacteria bacterium]
MKLFQLIEDVLTPTKISLDEFQELIVRLMNYTVLTRTESATEEALYDRFVRIESLVVEYLEVMKIRTYHDSHFQYVRLYPPSAEVPGIADSEDSNYSGSLRQRLNQNEVALTLILRLQYDKALREGKIDDNGYALESLESISIAMKNMLKRSLPEKLTERKKLFQKLRQLRLIQFRQEEEFESGETWIKVHPMIVTFVSEAALELLDAEAVDETSTPEQNNVVSSTLVAEENS